jgi:N-acyl-D-amino-acid deacylase
MRQEVRLGLEAGARTLSFGLIYLPGTYADTDELVAVSEVAAEFGAPLVPHVRNEGIAVLEALGEMVEVARRSGAPLHVSHLKSRTDEALIPAMLELLERASEDVSLSFDQYPYGAGSTVLSALLPPWAQEGGASATLARLADPSARERMAADMAVETAEWEGILGSLGPERVVLANAAPPNEGVVGRTLAEVAADRGVDPFTATFDLLVESALDVTMISHYASDAAVRRIAAHRLQLVGSDSIFGAKPHPRLYGTAARFLGRFAIRDGLVPVEEAVCRLTARAADRIGLPDRGRIEPGKRADLVLLRPSQLHHAPDVDPYTTLVYAARPDDVRSVWVDGHLLVGDGQLVRDDEGAILSAARAAAATLAARAF